MIHADLKTVLDVYSAVLVFVAAVPANLFPLIYSRRPWTRTFVGRALMTNAVGLALLVDTSMFRIVWGNDHEWLSVVRAVVFSIITTGVTLLLIALVASDRAQRQLDRATDPARLESDQARD